MKKPAILTSLGLLVGAIALAQGMPVQLQSGTAGTSGLVEFNLVGGDGSSLPVKVAVNAGDSGATIASKIVAAATVQNWAASTDGVSVTFSHNGGLGWLPVCDVENVVDTADAAVTLLTKNTHALLDLALQPSVAASGYDSQGKPSFLTLNVQGEANPYTVVLRPGQSPMSIMQGIVQYLRLAGVGLDFTQVSLTEVRISLRFVHSYLSVQTSDVQLQTGLSISDKSLTDQTGLIDR